MAYISTNKPPVYGTVNPNNGSYFFNLNEQKWYDTSGNFMPNGMTFLPCITYADHNGQVEYVEQLPKTVYVDEIKANEFKGKNAITASVVVDCTTTAPTIKDSYNISSVIKTTIGVSRVYFSTRMDNLTYTWGYGAYSSTGYLANEISRTLDYIEISTFNIVGTSQYNALLTLTFTGGKN